MGKTYLFTHVSEEENCGVIIYDKKTKKEILRHAFSDSGRIGKKHRLSLEMDLNIDALYQFYDGERRMPDPKGRAFISFKKYGEEKNPEDVYSVLEVPAYDWGRDANPKLPYDEMLIYCLHVRGFTRHVSSGVQGRGTFAGATEKIAYLKEIGVTTLEFQPINEFIEKKADHSRLNYWGYEKGFYFAPKASYAQKEPTTECKDMIKAFHEAGIEIVLQFYFPAEFNPMDVPEILRFWVEEYHVDGFHLIGENLPSDMIAKDPELSETKIWYYQFDPEKVYGRRNVPAYKNLALLRDDFLYEGRRFIKGDEGLVPAMTNHLRSIPTALGRINYLSTYWGFTMMDAVSYDFKHNEANGEENHDGTDYNCSWNCGEEGPSRKKKIRSLRLRQLKNSFCLLMFAQGTPRIFMGDEFGNSQKGNNNPYCQDNEVTWLNWTGTDKNEEILLFFKKLVEIRKENKILHPEKEAQLMDSISCGYPDLSFHGETAWRPQLENYSRQLGVMYCGLYGENREEFLYLAINMHWESHGIGLPRLPKGKKWIASFFTNEEMTAEDSYQEVMILPPKTIALLLCRDEPQKDSSIEIDENSERFSADDV